MMVIDKQLQTLEASGVRAMKYVKYFARNYATDKFIICMIMLIVFALIGVIVACILKGKNGLVYVSSDGVSNSTSSSSSSSGLR
jgi:ABC-type transporter Mla maintaining outer membrane lipid asymmetry permease subunit MlaE